MVFTIDEMKKVIEAARKALAEGNWAVIQGALASYDAAMVQKAADDKVRFDAQAVPCSACKKLFLDNFDNFGFCSIGCRYFGD